MTATSRGHRGQMLLDLRSVLADVMTHTVIIQTWQQERENPQTGALGLPCTASSRRTLVRCRGVLRSCQRCVCLWGVLWVGLMPLLSLHKLREHAAYTVRWWPLALPMGWDAVPRRHACQTIRCGMAVLRDLEAVVYGKLVFAAVGGTQPKPKPSEVTVRASTPTVTFPIARAPVRRSSLEASALTKF